MKEIRELLQAKFEEIEDLEVSPEIPDDILEKGKTYFTYTLNKIYIGSDMGKKYTYRINIIGFVKRLQDDEENTLEIVDNKCEELKNKMKELNIKSNFNDVSIIDGIRKMQVSANVEYNEINNGLI